MPDARMWLCGYIPGQLSISRYNRRIHVLRGWLVMLLDVLGTLFSSASVYIIDSLPLPVCRRVRLPLLQGARSSVLWLLRCQRRNVLWLAIALGVYDQRATGEFQPVTCLVPRLNTGA